MGGDSSRWVRFLGALEAEDLAESYRMADLFAMP
jgi:hypothetical protein